MKNNNLLSKILPLHFHQVVNSEKWQLNVISFQSNKVIILEGKEIVKNNFKITVDHMAENKSWRVI